MSSDDVIRVLLGSTSAFKSEAVKRAFETAFPANIIQVTLTNAESKVNEQPFGWEEITRGAHNRIQHAIAIASSNTHDYAVAIENGIIEAPSGLPSELTNGTQTLYMDVAFVLIQCCKTKKIFYSSSTSLPVPYALLEETRSIGFDKTHVGFVLVQKHPNKGIHPNDPHASLTMGLCPRISLMQQAVLCALGQMRYMEMKNDDILW